MSGRKRAGVGIPVFLAALAIAALVVAGCGKSAPQSASVSGGGRQTATIGMNTANFTTHSITVQAGQPVTFDDTVDGGALHILCVGTGTGGSNTCDSASQAPNAPTKLVGQGLTMNPGEKQVITFATPGAYHVICTIHPGMYIDITVK